VKDEVVPLIVKEFGIAISDIYFLEGNGLKVFFVLLLYLYPGEKRPQGLVCFLTMIMIILFPCVITIVLFPGEHRPEGSFFF
jgi:hypothetical protein